ncbi:hypothetical protein J7E97_27075 [Streptomyces sp. ISL-66]|uniref:hypothetical protein n=1 Tax=Streptomyces sp. ISL-66 TaxID=2819186 RepID=UPI001BE99FFF|nr:hypothetical protein [Streptomyces sp. ISL-66]MBT2471426.1 hypothetical protein [Streptomyces sp. ISL-66]
MTPVRRALAAAAALIGPALLATGCGSIATTGVVESGHAGTVNLATLPYPDLLYFIAPDGGLVPVTVSDQVRLTPTVVLRMLLAGPGASAREAGLTTELPPPDTKEYIATGITVEGNGKSLKVLLPFAVEPLSERARRQLACTARATARIDSAPQILLVGPDGKEERAVCRTEG